MLSQIALNDIETWVAILTRMLEAKGVDSIDVDDVDFYWTINAGDQLDLRQAPEPAVGSLKDDLRELRKVSRGGSMPTPVDLDRFAAVLRVISEKL